MASIVVGSLTFVSETVNGKEVFKGTLPSGTPVTISAETISKSDDDAYISGKRTSTLNKLTDPADQAALNAFYDAAPTALAPLRQSNEEAAASNESKNTTAAENQEKSNQSTPSGSDDPTKSTNSKSDDDSGSNTNNDNISSASNGSTRGMTINPNTGQPIANSKTTIAGKAGSTKTGTKEDVLGRRTYNPLGDFSSYTYKISLYYMDPIQFNEYVNGNNAIIKDFKLIAQSGGATQGVDNKATGFDLDFYIDDLEIKTLINSKETMSMSNSALFKFKIYEPYGFTFTKKLASALDLSTPELKNVKGHFLLMFRFYGYDINGKLLRSSEVQGSPVNNSDPQAIFERGFPVVFQKFKFKLDYKTVVYDIEAVQVNEQVAKGVSRGTVPAKVTIAGETIEEILLGNSNKKSVTGLIDVLNAHEKSLTTGDKPAFEKANEYKIEFVNADEIKNALMAPQDDVDKKKVPNAPVKNSAGSNVRTEYNNKDGVIEKKIRKMELNGQTSIIQAIDQIISQSSYIKDALNSYDKENEKVYDSETEVYNNPNPKTISWYNVTPKVNAIGKDRDSKRQDYAYKITYVISKYEIPFVRALYASKTTKYYGPHKRYNYWYTGKNSEIISFDLDYNYLYQLDVVGQSDATSNNTGSASTTAKASQNADPSGSDTGTNEQVASMKSWLYSPGDLVKFRLKIQGDPDYLMPTVGGGLDSVGKTFKPYGPDFTINPNSGQVFIEIDFKQAEDYDITNGLLGPNGDISFMNYPPELQSKIKGMTFMITEVVSKFSKGKFEQDIRGILPEFTTVGDKSREQNKATPDKSRTTSKTNENVSTETGGGRSSGNFAKVDPRRLDLVNKQDNTVVTNPGGVADDDGSSNSAEMLKFKRQQEMNKPTQGGRTNTSSATTSTNQNSYARDYSGDGNVTDYGLG